MDENKAKKLSFVAGPNNIPVPGKYVILLRETVEHAKRATDNGVIALENARQATTIRDCIHQLEQVGGSDHIEVALEHLGAEDEDALDEQITSELYDLLWEHTLMDWTTGMVRNGIGYACEDCYLDLRLIEEVHPFLAVATHDPSIAFATTVELEKAMAALKAVGHDVVRDDELIMDAYRDIT